MEYDPIRGGPVLPGNVAQHTPAQTEAPRKSPAKHSSGRALAGLLALALVGGIVIGRGASALDGVPLTSSVSRLAAGVSGSLAKAPVASIQHAVADKDSTDPQAAAVQAVIHTANDEQVQAIAAHDPSGMQDTSTPGYYQQLVQTNQDLLDNGVTAIQLVKLEWGPVSVNGDTATATSYETWSTTFDTGATQQSRDRNDYTLVKDQGVWKIQTDEHPQDAASGGTSPQQPQPASPGSPEGQPASPVSPDGQSGSMNWSGYAAGNGKYTAVSGTWTVPSPTANGTDGADAVWVGIGGLENRDLIQAGTDEMVSADGQVQDEAWIETLPQSARPVPLPVHPGDSMTVSITSTGNSTWQIVLKNNTTGKSFSDTEHYASTMSSAEWVEEAPSGRRGLAPLDDFGTVQFTDGSAVKDGQTVTIAQANAQPITMINSAGQALAVPSTLGADGTSFTVGRTSVSADAGQGQAPGNPRPRRHRIGG